MMFRYVVVIWCAKNEERTRAAELIASRLKAVHWQEAMHVAGMRVLELGARPGGLETHVLPNHAGVVIGRTFVRSSDELDESPAPHWRATPADAHAILESRGRWLIERCWGNYVAVLKPAEPNRISIVKDPTGTLPCFITESAGVQLIFSLPDDLVRLGLCRFTINREYLRTRVLHGADATVRPLNEVEQIRNGECVELDAQAARIASRRYLWRPQTFTEPDDRYEDPELAARVMRTIVRMSTHTLAATESRIVHRLSGGLDSSIIAGCLKDAPNRPHVCCYTYFTPGAPSDERPWARMAAEHSGFEHREVPISWQDIDLRRALEMPLLVEPATILMYTLRSTIEQAIAADVKAAVVFNGDGGDSIFGAEAVRYAAFEYLRRRGFGRGFLKMAADVALRTQQSTWGVVRGAVRGLLLGHQTDPMETMRPELSRLCSPEVLASQSSRKVFSHPWFEDDQRMPWPIVSRLGTLVLRPQFFDANIRDSAPEVISPLYSQAVTETLLRMPLDRLFENGRDRGLARRAFVREVPQPILERLWKDRAPGFHQQLIFHNRVFLRETFLDGVLVREGLLDRVEIERALTDCPTKTQVLPAEMMRQLDLEFWANAWECSALTEQRLIPVLRAY